MAIASHADALILVAGVDRVRREALVEARRVLERCPTFTLGVIATGAKATERVNHRERFDSAMRRTRNGRVGRASGELLTEISTSVRSIASASRRRPTRPSASPPDVHAGPPDVQERPQRVPDV
jgi:hypothetical protein